MIRIGILGDIGSGKSYVAKNFGYPVFNADIEVGKLYIKDIKVFNKLKKVLPKYIYSFPINKNEISYAILANKFNLKKIVRVVHFELRKKMNIFIKKYRNKKIIILDIPLLLENKINKKNDILVFVDSKKLDIKFKNIQLPIDYKKKKSQFIIKNNFTNKSVKRGIKIILKEIL